MSEKKEEKKRLQHQVSASVRVMSISQVSTVEQSFNADFLLVLTWIDRSLIGANPKDIDWDTTTTLSWNPKFSIKNALELERLEETGGRRLEDPSTGLVKETARFRGSLSQYLELETFPFDTQELTIVLACNKSSSELIFEMPPPDKIKLNKFIMPEWQFLATKWQVVLTDPSESTSKRSYSELHVKLQAMRKSESYLWNVGVVTFIIVSLAFLAFCMRPEELSNRLAVTLTLLLTAVAFKLMVSDSLPKVAYLTLLDKYILAAFLFLYIIALENGCVSCIIDDEWRSSVDYVFARLVFGLWFCFQLYVVYFVRSISCIRKQKEREAASLDTASKSIIKSSDSALKKK
eukprot:TRINITY_DN1047_c0_g1_i1.p1 TRINITY_DN1047_c0_g1~~TRINITY_DN1047_c0_g1_i1.p1  ORF type:complete len:348 (+),score=87.96 TRINITY_DN1047_c0_g1_i1:101-1144(+)